MTKPFSEVVPVPDCAPGCVLIFPPWRHRCYLESKTNPGWTKLVENRSVIFFVRVFLTNLRIDQLLFNLTKCEVAPSVVAVWLGGDPRWRPHCRQTGKRPTPAAGGTETIFHTTSEVWDDGVIDPRDTRKYLSLCLAAVYKSEIKGSNSFGVFRM